MADSGTLSPTQHRAIASLLAERTTRDAAQAAGIAERSLWRWLNDATFRAELEAQEAELLGEAGRRLLSLQGAALEVFRRVMADETATDANQLRAAQAVIDSLLKVRELVTLEKRIEELERTLRT